MRNYVNVDGRYDSFSFLPQEPLVSEQHGMRKGSLILFALPLVFQFHEPAEFLVLLTGIMAGRMALSTVPARRSIVRHERTIMPFHSRTPRETLRLQRPAVRYLP